MTAYIPVERESHWYFPDGRPCHQVPNQSKRNEYRPTTVRDAKALGLFPSVTNILGVIHRYVLETWKLNQMLRAAVALPRLPDESDDAYVERLLDLAELPSREGADFGTRVHRAIDHWLKHGYVVADDEVMPFIEGFRGWFGATGLKIIQSEKSFANVKERYGGTVDLIGSKHGVMVIDWKTQKREKITHYPEWRLQVAAYAKGLDVETGKYATVCISSEVPGIISVDEYGDTENEQAWREFLAAKALWYGRVGKGWELAA